MQYSRPQYASLPIDDGPPLYHDPSITPDETKYSHSYQYKPPAKPDTTFLEPGLDRGASYKWCTWYCHSGRFNMVVWTGKEFNHRSPGLRRRQQASTDRSRARQQA
jgi:hypothetical protein